MSLVTAEQARCAAEDTQALAHDAWESIGRAVMVAAHLGVRSVVGPVGSKELAGATAELAKSLGFEVEVAEDGGQFALLVRW